MNRESGGMLLCLAESTSSFFLLIDAAPILIMGYSGGSSRYLLDRSFYDSHCSLGSSTAVRAVRRYKSARSASAASSMTLDRSRCIKYSKASSSFSLIPFLSLSLSIVPSSPLSGLDRRKLFRSDRFPTIKMREPASRGGQSGEK